MQLLIFLLASYGVTNIVTSGKIFEWLRKLLDRRSKVLGYWIKCPMCMGLWVGTVWCLLGLGPGSHLSRWMDVAVAGTVASGWCWIARVVLARLGEDAL
jgi:hypothetical protein